MGTPFDDLCHFTFQHPRHAVPWLRSALPHPFRTRIDWSSLRAAPEKLRGGSLDLSVADAVFDARTTDDEPLRILTEHKAQRDPAAEQQLLRYAVLLRERSTRRGAPVPIVTVLLHHGERPYAAPASAAHWLRPWQPHLPIVVDDLSQTTETAIRARGMTPLGTLTLLCLRFLRAASAETAIAAFERWGDLLRETDQDDGPPDGHEAIAAMGRYALLVVDVPPRTLRDTFERLLQRPEETIMSTAEKLRAEGRMEGRVEGRTALLLLLLKRRFGELPQGILDRVHAAGVPDLERWAERVLDARSLEEVFAG